MAQAKALATVVQIGQNDCKGTQLFEILFDETVCMITRAIEISCLGTLIRPLLFRLFTNQQTLRRVAYF